MSTVSFFLYLIDTSDRIGFNLWTPGPFQQLWTPGNKNCQVRIAPLHLCFVGVWNRVIRTKRRICLGANILYSDLPWESSTQSQKWCFCFRYNCYSTASEKCRDEIKTIKKIQTYSVMTAYRTCDMRLWALYTSGPQSSHFTDEMRKLKLLEPAWYNQGHLARAFARSTWALYLPIQCGFEGLTKGISAAGHW